MSAVLEVHPSPLSPGPIGGPAAWKGPAIVSPARKRDWIYEFTRADLAELDAAVRAHFAAGREMGDITPQTFRLPTLAAHLERVLEDVLHGMGFSLQERNSFSELVAGFRVKTEFDLTPRPK